MFLITHGFLSLRSRDGFDEQKEQLGFDVRILPLLKAPFLHLSPLVSPTLVREQKAVEECKYRMSRYGVTPNMLILPPQMLLYMALAPEAKLLYKEGGPAAEARFEGGVAGIEAKAFRGCGVFTSEPFEVSDDQDSVQMLTRSTQVGEFYIMQPPQINPGFGKTMFTADIMIYDEESDRHVRIEWDDAMNACRVDDLDNDIVLKNFPASTDGKVKSTWKAAAAEISKFNKGLKGDSTAIANETETADMFNTLQKECRIMVVRPFIEHLMHSAILAVSGRDTGATLFGPAGAPMLVPLCSMCTHTLTAPFVMRRHAAVGQHPGQDDRGSLHVCDYATRTFVCIQIHTRKKRCLPNNRITAAKTIGNNKFRW
jgi:hypothetical protein